MSSPYDTSTSSVAPSPSANTSEPLKPVTGYTQELNKTRGSLHVLSMAIAMIAAPCGLSLGMETAFIGGGHAAMFWGWILISFTTQLLSLSLAEISSKYPTSAGAYYWCFRMTPPKYRRLVSWITGWLNIVGVWTMSLSATAGTTQLLISGVRILRPSWEPEEWVIYMIFVALSVTYTLVGILFSEALPILDVISVWWTTIGVIIVGVSLSVKASTGRHSASFAFFHFDPSLSGWIPGWSFFVGLLPPAFTFGGFGTVVSIAEELHRPSVQLPFAFKWGVPIGFVQGLVFMLPVIFVLPDISVILSSSRGQPIAPVFELVMGSKTGGFLLWLLVFGTGIFACMSLSCAASRTTWTFARDNALPLSSLWSQVAQVNFHLITSRSKPGVPAPKSVPILAYLLSLAIQLLLGVLLLFSSAAFNAFSGVAVICLNFSYSMPIFVSLVTGRKDMKDAPFSLGKWGWFVNSFTVLWTLLELVLFSMPSVLHVDRVTMNYASVVFVGFATISALWYLFHGRYYYRGPPELDFSPANEKISDLERVSRLAHTRSSLVLEEHHQHTLNI